MGVATGRVITQFGGGASFGHAPGIEHQDLVEPFHRGEPVGDHDGGSILEQSVDRPSDPGFGQRVDTRRGFVEQYEVGGPKEQPGKCNELAFACGQAAAGWAKFGVESIRHCFDPGE